MARCDQGAGPIVIGKQFSNNRSTIVKCAHFTLSFASMNSLDSSEKW